MALSRTSVGVIVGLIVLALSGLVVVQATMLTTTWRQEEQAFRSNVMTALATVQRRLLARETMDLAFSMDGKFPPQGDTVNLQVQAITDVGDTVALARVLRGNPAGRPMYSVKDNVVVYRLNEPQHVTVKVEDPTSGEQTILEDTFRVAGDHRIELPDTLGSNAVFMWDCWSDSASFTYEFEAVLSDSLQTPASTDSSQVFIRTLVNQLQLGDVKPIDERINPDQLDSLIEASLDDAGVNLEYAFAVQTRPDDSLYFVDRTEDTAALRQSEFRTPLFPHDLFSQRADLLVFFPGRDVFLWRQLGSMALPTVVLMTIIVGCFVYTIRTILAQHRFSALLVDFINNMTHEFKTPISTVQLACDAIKRPDVRSEPEQVLRFNRMIEEEARRMKGQTDRILQMAVLERGDYELTAAPVDIHDVIDKAVAAVALHIDKRGGRLTSHPSATRTIVQGDAVHLTNVIHNLLDNANKYSPEKPSIAIETMDTDNGLRIIVSDSGVGMSPEHQKMAFQKYFRVPSGNVHNVKGFGLGLSYVQLMVEAHGGHVALSSRLGEGTRVSVYLPASRGDA